MKKLFTFFCFLVLPIIIFSQDLKVVTLDIAISCSGECDAQIIVNATGGVPPYVYSLNDSFQTTNTFSNLCSGDYSIVVKDAEGTTTNSTMVTVSEPTALIGVVTTTSASVNEADGTIEINASGGQAPYLYSIDGVNYQPEYVFSNLLSGNYDVSVKDANACVHSSTVSVVEMASEIAVAELVGNTSLIEDVSCSGSCDARIAVRATGGVPPYTYSINDSFQTSNTFSGLCSGDYNIEVKDVKGTITNVTTITVSEPSALTATVTNILPSTDEPSGVIEINVSEGTPPYLYAISPNLDLFSSQNVFSNLPSGTYEVITQDSNGCFVINLVTIDQVNIDNTVAINGDTLTPNLKADTYQWINADTQTIIEGATNKTFKAEQTGRYRVEMTVTGASLATKNAKGTGVTVVSSPVYEITVLGVNDKVSNTLRIYPSPTEAYLMLPTTSINKNYSVHSVLGQKIDSGKVINKELSVENLSKGIYYLSIEGYDTSKFIKK